ncbi:Hypothetical protein CINCED_3A015989 [Cinara cedri]|uniref:BZIP domain-containing protein n=2 Tax=Cinara cedri TaxID=506608 RepID=A0A5E4MES5_9HEMI|nr:Hypothetical protein CINCED_3A015989 [Cinara cedri]
MSKLETSDSSNLSLYYKEFGRMDENPNITAQNKLFQELNEMMMESFYLPLTEDVQYSSEITDLITNYQIDWNIELCFENGIDLTENGISLPSSPSSNESILSSDSQSSLNSNREKLNISNLSNDNNACKTLDTDSSPPEIWKFPVPTEQTLNKDISSKTNTSINNNLSLMLSNHANNISSPASPSSSLSTLSNDFQSSLNLNREKSKIFENLSNDNNTFETRKADSPTRVIWTFPVPTEPTLNANISSKTNRSINNNFDMCSMLSNRTNNISSPASPSSSLSTLSSDSQSSLNLNREILKISENLSNDNNTFQTRRAASPTRVIWTFPVSTEQTLNADISSKSNSTINNNCDVPSIISNHTNNISPPSSLSFIDLTLSSDSQTSLNSNREKSKVTANLNNDNNMCQPRNANASAHEIWTFPVPTEQTVNEDISSKTNSSRNNNCDVPSMLSNHINNISPPVSLSLIESALSSNSLSSINLNRKKSKKSTNLINENNMSKTRNTDSRTRRIRKFPVRTKPTLKADISKETNSSINNNCDVPSRLSNHINNISPPVSLSLIESTLSSDSQTSINSNRKKSKKSSILSSENDMCKTHNTVSRTSKISKFTVPTKPTLNADMSSETISSNNNNFSLLVDVCSMLSNRTNTISPPASLSSIESTLSSNTQSSLNLNRKKLKTSNLSNENNMCEPHNTDSATPIIKKFPVPTKPTLNADISSITNSSINDNFSLLVDVCSMISNHTNNMSPPASLSSIQSTSNSGSQSSLNLNRKKSKKSSNLTNESNMCKTSNTDSRTRKNKKLSVSTKPTLNADISSETNSSTTLPASIESTPSRDSQSSLNLNRKKLKKSPNLSNENIMCNTRNTVSRSRNIKKFPVPTKSTLNADISSETNSSKNNNFCLLVDVCSMLSNHTNNISSPALPPSIESTPSRDSQSPLNLNKKKLKKSSNSSNENNMSKTRNTVSRTRKIKKLSVPTKPTLNADISSETNSSTTLPPSIESTPSRDSQSSLNLNKKKLKKSSNLSNENFICKTRDTDSPIAKIRNLPVPTNPTLNADISSETNSTKNNSFDVSSLLCNPINSSQSTESNICASNDPQTISLTPVGFGFSKITKLICGSVIPGVLKSKTKSNNRLTLPKGGIDKSFSSLPIANQKRLQRLIRNREAACLSRLKRKEYVASIEKKLHILEKENLKLKKTI